MQEGADCLKADTRSGDDRGKLEITQGGVSMPDCLKIMTNMHELSKSMSAVAILK